MDGTRGYETEASSRGKQTKLDTSKRVDPDLELLYRGEYCCHCLFSPLSPGCFESGLLRPTCDRQSTTQYDRGPRRREKEAEKNISPRKNTGTRESSAPSA